MKKFHVKATCLEIEEDNRIEQRADSIVGSSVYAWKTGIAMSKTISNGSHESQLKFTQVNSISLETLNSVFKM